MAPATVAPTTVATEVLAAVDAQDVDWEAIEVPWDVTSRRSPLAGRTEADFRAHVLQLEQRRRVAAAQEEADRQAAMAEWSDDWEPDAGGGSEWFVGDADTPSNVPVRVPAPLSGPGAVHPLDEPAFDLEGLLRQAGDTDSPGWPCPQAGGDALGHWVAARSGWHEIGWVEVDLDCAPGAADVAPPGLHSVWARCKSCFWPVFCLALYNDATAESGFFAELGASDGDVLQTPWRLLTPARAEAVGAAWPVPWHFATPHEVTGVPW